MTVHYTKRAEQALDSTAKYTQQEWGEARRDRYMAMLEHACEKLVPVLSQVALSVPNRPHLRALRCERHVIYFRSVVDGFEIVHVLHERQLPKRHMG